MISAARILRGTMLILLQFTPRSVDFDAVIVDMTAMKGVEGVHHVQLDHGDIFGVRSKEKRYWPGRFTDPAPAGMHFYDSRIPEAD